MNRILFVEAAGATSVSRYARLYLRYKGELTEIDPKVRIIVASGFGFVITSDAISVCVKNYVEVIITDAAQSFVGIHAPYAIGLTSRNSLMMRVQQLAAITDKRKGLHVARDIVHRKIMAERHSKSVREGFLVELGKCKSVDHVRHVEARSAQEWWKRWRDFEIKFVKGFKPPERWRKFETRYIGRVQGKAGELGRQFTARFAETPLQAMHNFAVGIVATRMTRVVIAKGMDPAFGFLHDGKKPGRYSLSWDVIETCRPALAESVFGYAGSKIFERADFAQQDGVIRLMRGIARECVEVACKTVTLAMMVREVKKIETML